MPDSSSARGASLSRVLWMGGVQWAGKTTVSRLIAVRHPLIHYAYDYHDARDHSARARREPERYPRRAALLATLDRGADELWVRRTPTEMAANTLLDFRERFDMVLDDLAAIPLGVPILAEGWGLRPELVAPYLTSPRQALFLVPTDEFREHQMRTLPRAAGINVPGITDPDRAQRNRLERDRLIAADLLENAARLGLSVQMVDGTRGPDDVALMVEEHFRPFLPRWRY